VAESDTTRRFDHRTVHPNGRATCHTGRPVWLTHIGRPGAILPPPTFSAYDARDDKQWPLPVSANWRGLSMTGL
jgi:hypothetical protein